MVSAQWLKVKEIVAEALELQPGERPAFLDSVCPDDSELRSEVDSLLAASSDGGTFSKMIWGAVIASGWETPASIGPYRLDRELGSGGMGQVWLAEQTKPVQRWVALKLIRGGLYESAVVERFLAERQSLALMNHPAIAKVFDAGTTEAGQPYLAMEYVDGLSITAYCDAKKLSVAERLRLFLQVCEGVQHAHRKAIIHRDLKPSNILVVEVDGKPSPRIIDFGLAKSAIASDETKRTQIGCFLGTPGYMSPEQADADCLDVDTRADVYSLGVVLYELLTGCLPFEARRWKEQRFDQEPSRPSTKAGALKAAAENRGMDARQLARALRGDLDWITLKALERDRERRYGSPADLAADVERYLENRPVGARPASWSYGVRKYLRRHRVAAAVCAGALVLLIAFAAAQSLQLRRTRRERDRADRITKFMTGLFEVSDPHKARGNSITVREILDKGSAEIQTELNSDPELQAELMQVMGRVYEDLGLASRARPLIEKSVAMRRRVLGTDDPKTLVSMDELAWLLDQEGHPNEAIKLQEESLASRRRVQGPDHADVRKSVSNLAVFLADAGRFAEAEKMDRETLAADLRLLGPDNVETLTSEGNLATDLLRDGRYQDAKTMLSEALGRERKTLGAHDPLTLASMNNLAFALFRLGQYAEAERMQLETREIQRRVLGPEHPETAGSTYNLALFAERQGQREKAIVLLKEAMAHGLGPVELAGMKTDEDLRSMRGDPQFEALVNGH